jgi:hypothetical protein
MTAQPRRLSPRIPKVALRRVLHALESAGAALPAGAKRVLGEALQAEFWRGYRVALFDEESVTLEYQVSVSRAGAELEKRMGKLREGLPKGGWPLPLGKEPKA